MKINMNGFDSEFLGSRDEGFKEVSNDIDGNFFEIIWFLKWRCFIWFLDDDLIDDESVFF